MNLTENELRLDAHRMGAEIGELEAIRARLEACQPLVWRGVAGREATRATDELRADLVGVIDSLSALRSRFGGLALRAVIAEMPGIEAA